jgi:hypothetical protein
MDRKAIDYDLAPKIIDTKLDFCKVKALVATNFLMKKFWEKFRKYSNFTDCPIRKV